MRGDDDQVLCIHSTVAHSRKYRPIKCRWAEMKWEDSINDPIDAAWSQMNAYV